MISAHRWITRLRNRRKGFEQGHITKQWNWQQWSRGDQTLLTASLGQTEGLAWLVTQHLTASLGKLRDGTVIQQCSPPCKGSDLFFCLLLSVILWLVFLFPGHFPALLHPLLDAEWHKVFRLKMTAVFSSDPPSPSGPCFYRNIFNTVLLCAVVGILKMGCKSRYYNGCLEADSEYMKNYEFQFF